MNRIAIIDCGTNTFNLLISDVNDLGEWTTVFQNKIPVKLGSGGFADNRITQQRYFRGLDALNCHKQNIINHSCNYVYAYATSAIRESSNGMAFVNDAKKYFDINIEVINGEREAELIYAGIVQTMTLDEKPVLIMDIGGGSTEFVIASEKGVLWKESYLIGVSRLYEQLNPGDKLTKDDITALQGILRNVLQSLADALNKYKPERLVGSSGSFDTLLDMYLFTMNESKSKISLSNEIPLHALPGICDWLIGSTLHERLNHPKIPDIRAEYMPLAACLVQFVLNMAPFHSLVHSAYSLKEGALAEIKNKHMIATSNNQ